jgi:hypothetical protein
MDIKKIMKQYYESEIDGINVVTPPQDILKDEPKALNHPLKFSLENVFGCIITGGYLLFILNPGYWFSFGNCLLSFRLGFLF